MRTILIIDDDAVVRKLFEISLKDSSCRLHLAASGEEGLDLAQQNRVDLVYLDLNLPGMDGVSTLRKLRAQGCIATVCIITEFESRFLNLLQAAAKEELRFELFRKPLSEDKIRRLTESMLNGLMSNGLIQKVTRLDKQNKKERGGGVLVLHLFLSSSVQRNSGRDVKNMRSFLDKNLSRPYQIKVHDVLSNPELAEQFNIIATPTLIKVCPEPKQTFVGDVASSVNLIKICKNISN